MPIYMNSWADGNFDAVGKLEERWDWVGPSSVYVVLPALDRLLAQSKDEEKPSDLTLKCCCSCVLAAGLGERSAKPGMRSSGCWFGPFQQGIPEEECDEESPEMPL